MGSKVIAFEGNCGNINVFYLQDGTPVWGARYWEVLSPATAAWDYEAILRGVNPAEAGWEYGEFDDLAEVEGAYATLCKEVEARNNLAYVIAEDIETYPENAGICGELFLEAFEVAKDVAVRRDVHVPPVGKPKYVLVSSSAGSGPTCPEVNGTTNALFFSDRKSAVRAMVAEVVGSLSSELREEWSENGYDLQVEKDSFKVYDARDDDESEEYEITSNDAWYRFEGDTEDPSTWTGTWRIVKIPDLV